jgi:hypothetical protein
MRAAGTEKGILVNIEAKRAEPEMFWFNCWAAKELAGPIIFCSQSYGWQSRGMKPAPSDHLRAPQPADLGEALEVTSLATSGEPGGLLVRLAINKSRRHALLFFTANAALEIMSYVVRAATDAHWWDSGTDYELIPCREGQH